MAELSLTRRPSQIGSLRVLERANVGVVLVMIDLGDPCAASLRGAGLVDTGGWPIL